MKLARSPWFYPPTLVWLIAALPTALADNPSHGPIPGHSASERSADLSQLQKQLAERFQRTQQWDQINELMKNPQALDQLKGNEQLLKALVDAYQNHELTFVANDPLVEKLAGVARDSPTSLDPDLVKQIHEMVQDVNQQPSKSARGDQPGRAGNQFKPPVEQPQEGGPKQGFRRERVELPSAKSQGATPLRSMPEQSSKTDRWRTEIEKWAQTNKSLQNSPALRQALEDLAHAHLRGAPSTRGAGELTSGERMVQWIGDRLPADRLWNNTVLPKIQNIPLPSLPNLDVPKFNLPAPSLPSLDVPPVTMPPPSISGGESVFLTLLAGAAVALVLWKLYGGRRHRRIAQPGPDWAKANGRGPAPVSVDLSTLASREDLIRAFEHLSLVKLGMVARSWNHLHLAAGLGGERGAQRQIANHLAFLYEQARYAPGDSRLSPHALRTAQHELAILAGVASV
jgi:hypothetical protein